MTRMLDAGTLDRLTAEAGFGSWGALPYDPADRVLPCKRAALILEGMRSLLILTLPYLAGRTPGSISKYARGADYHRVAAARLDLLAAKLAAWAGGGRFIGFCDSSPFDETALALRAGLGCRGENHRLITPRYGSYVFLATLLCDLPLPSTAVETIPTCLGCGRCVAHCPGGALREKDGFCLDLCLSERTQRKGELPDWVMEAMRKVGTGWGCDVCQDVCPMNAHAAQTTLPEFLEQLTPDLTEPVIAASPSRAYGWRGKSILRRNLEILRGAESAGDCAARAANVGERGRKVR